MAKANVILSEIYNSSNACEIPQISRLEPFAVEAFFYIYETGATLAAVADGCRDIPEMTGTLVETVDLSGVLPVFLSSAGIKYDYPELVLTTPTVARLVVAGIVNGARVEFEWYQTYNPTNPWPPMPPESLNLYVARDFATSLVQSVDGGLTFPNLVPTGIGTVANSAMVASLDGMLFHFGFGTNGRVSTDEVNFNAITGLATSSGFQPGDGTLIKVGTEYQLYTYGLFISTNGLFFSERTLSVSVRRPAVFDGVIVAISDGNRLATSLDSGATFANYVVSGFAAIEGFQRLIATPYSIVAFGQDASGFLRIAYSLTGLAGTWSYVLGTPASASICHGVASDPVSGRIVMVLSSGTTYYSDDDGGTWNLGASGISGSVTAFPDEPASNMIYSNDAYFICRNVGSGFNAVYRSPDGVEAWQIVYIVSPSATAATSICVYRAGA